MGHAGRRVSRLLTALLLAGLVPGSPSTPGLGAQEAVGGSAVLRGRVLDAATGRPVAAARVEVLEADRGALTGDDGAFEIARLAVGAAVVRVEAPGYATARADVRLRPDTVAEIVVPLRSEPFSLERIVATVTGDQRSRALANQVAHIDAPQALEGTTVTRVSELLTARSPGVVTLSSSGVVGGGTRIRMRGAGSIALSNDPVVYLDGIRVESGVASGSVNVGGQVPSRLDDLNPEEIASVEIVRGASAATLYGTDASSGVVRVRTRRGRPGPTRMEAWVEAGVVQDVNDYPANHFARAEGGGECFTFMVAVGLCRQAGIQSASPLLDARTSPLQTGLRYRMGANASGGSERLSFFLSGEWEEQEGVYGLPPVEKDALEEEFGPAFGDLPASQFEPNRLERLSLRGNFGGRLWPRVNLWLHAGMVSSDLRLPQNDNNVLGILPSALLGHPSTDRDLDWGYRFHTPAEIYALAVSQEVDRVTASLRMEAEPRDWLSARATVGIDRVVRTDVQDVPRGRVSFGPVLPLGLRDVNTARLHTATLDAGLTARSGDRDRLALRSTVGVQFVGRRAERTDAHGEDLAPGSGTLGGAAVTRASEQASRVRTLGVYAEEEVAWRDRLFVTGALRADDNSAFGAEFDIILYPKLGLSWVLSEEPWFPEWEWVESGRLRATWGQSGAQPGPTDAIRFYIPRSVAADGREATGVVLGGLGNVDLEPERTSELEAGLDAELLDGRVRAALTFYDMSTTGLLVRAPLPPSGGVGADRLVNLGEVSNRGVELELDARVLEAGEVAWDLGLRGSVNDNELVDLGDQPPIVQGLQRFVEGYPLGGYWDRPLRWEDADGDGLIRPEEVAVGLQPVFLGHSLPTRTAAVWTEVTLWDRLRLSALAEYRGGHALRNLTEVYRCQYTICRGYNDPAASLRDQARALSQTVLPPALRTEAGFVEDASFWKLREVGASVGLPGSWAERVGASVATVTVAARNLHTWTGYSGIDPEVNQLGQTDFLSRDFLTQPQTRHAVLRVRVEF